MTSAMNEKLEIAAGTRFGRLVVIKEGHRKGKERRRTLICDCDCGTETVVVINRLRTGNTRSCGCLHREYASKAQSVMVEGMRSTDHPLYSTWKSMKTRCYNPNYRCYHRYGGRGIKICDRWKNSLANFVSDMGPRDKGCSIDRINNDGDYEPGNCRWSSQIVQTNNTERNVRLTFQNRTQTVAQWAHETGIPYHVFQYRIKAGWTTERILCQPIRGHAK